MRVLIIAQPRTGSTVFSRWLSKELNYEWVNEAFMLNDQKKIEKVFNSDNIVVKVIYEQGMGEWHITKKIQNINHLFSLNWDHIFILTRDNINDQAISNTWAGMNRKWHVNYQINDDWIKHNKKSIEKYHQQLSIDRNFLRSIKHQQITYEGVYEKKTDIEKVCNILNIDKMLYDMDLSKENRYRGGEIVQNTKLI